MQLGTLRITLPNWQTRDFAVQQPSISVGRDADNELVIDDPSISRRHARLTFEAGRLMVEDLGSSHGTYVGDQRVEANTPSLVPAGVAIRLADIELVYQPSLAYQATQNVSDPAPAETKAAARAQPPALPPTPPLRASLAGPAQPVVPGGATSASLTVQNLGSVVDEFVIRVSGVPAAWVRLSKDQVPLLPGAQEQVGITFQPPQSAEAVAADHRFTFTVMSREHRTGVNVQGVLKVLPYPGLALSLQPVRSGRDFQLIALNQGNAPVTVNLSGSDDEQSLLYHFAQATVALAPGQTASIGLSVTPKTAANIGARQARPFTIVAQPAHTGGAEVRTAGQLIVRPPIPLWLIPVVIILSLCVCISGAFGYVSLCDRLLPNGPFCRPDVMPVINVFSATPGEVDAGSTVVIAWDVSNAEQVELLAPTPETLDPSGLRTFTLHTNTTFVLRATNFAGSVEESLAVLVRGTAPSIEAFTATPGVITAGETGTIVLSWTTINAEAVMIEGVPEAELPPNGSVEVPAPSADTTYTLVVSNATGSARQAVTIVVTSIECSLTNIPTGQRLSLRAGPGGAFPEVVQLDNATRVDPLGRNSAGDWVHLRAAGREGWVPGSFVTCTSAQFLGGLPTVAPALVPTLAPTATSTPLPPTATGTALPPTLTPTHTATPTPTATPVFGSGGLITYRVQVDGLTTIYLQNVSGPPIRLVFDKADAEVLDYTPNNGGRFAIWVHEGGQQKVFVIDRSGQLIGAPITGGWGDITDADWSYDGQRLVVEAITAGATNYHYYDGNGNALGQPALP